MIDYYESAAVFTLCASLCWICKQPYEVSSKGLTNLQTAQAARAWQSCFCVPAWLSWARRWGQERAGNPLFFILQISESFSFSVGAHVINPQIICGLFLSSLSLPPPPSHSGNTSLFLPTTFSFSSFAVAILTSPILHLDPSGIWRKPQRLFWALSYTLIMTKEPLIHLDKIVQF